MGVEKTMSYVKTVGILIFLIILSSGCLSNDYSKIYYTTDMYGTIYTGEDCTEGCDERLDTIKTGKESWDQPYTESEWNESINLNFTSLVYEALPSGILDINIAMNDTFEDGPNEVYKQYKAEVIYPTTMIDITYKAWIVRK